MPGLNRPMGAGELSDGTLRYLCLMAALLSPRPPPFLALNEPEMSLHPDLLGPLSRLIVEAAKNSQIWVTTHADAAGGGHLPAHGLRAGAADQTRRSHGARGLGRQRGVTRAPLTWVSPPRLMA